MTFFFLKFYMPLKKIAIFVSGRGSNMEALLKAMRDEKKYPAYAVLVLSDNENAPALEIAQEFGIAVEALPPMDGEDKISYFKRISQKLQEYNPDYICLSGFMRLLPAEFCQRWAGRIINIHPSLLPAFRGLDTHKRALETGVKFAGCTVHYVTEKMDDGEIIAQAGLLIHEDETPQTLSKRVLKLEHKLYAKALKKICENHNNNISFFEI